MDVNQTWVMSVVPVWEPSFVDVVRGYIPMAKVLEFKYKIGQKCQNCLIWKVEVQYADFGFPIGSQFVPKFCPTMHRRCTNRYVSPSWFSAPPLNYTRILLRKY